MADGVMEGQLLLRFVMSAKCADDGSDEWPVIAVFDNEDAVVHDLRASPIGQCSCGASMGDLRNGITVRAFHGHSDAIGEDLR